MAALTLEKANLIVDAALAKGREMDCRPLTVAVLDAGGHLVALKREDGSGILRPEIAIGKAWGALGMGESSRMLSERPREAQGFLNALAAMSGGRVVPAPGGVLVRDAEGVLAGAVGISGDRSGKDEACALAGIAAAGLVGES